MLLMLALPVLIAVAGMHRYMQLYAPSNVLARRVRMARPTFRMTGVLLALAVVLVTAMHALAEQVAAGAPGWLNLVVLVLAWDGVKVALLAARSGSGALALSARSAFHPHREAGAGAS
ncbi:hypothetical protein [Nocardioides sp. Leaf285]|uniref:hypothetical protein n=1 Tax=Nocardioides sp. Leaf285 TaxID=1736322 RepID=UPI0007036EDA|nr:hypothetical protein [Nocardioides sp. Leaf285]KQP66908.1 hypothetical protein ASF47_04165 [Nocardioides sp. Leaf285]